VPCIAGYLDAAGASMVRIAQVASCKKKIQEIRRHATLNVSDILKHFLKALVTSRN